MPEETAAKMAQLVQQIPVLAHKVETTCISASGVWPPEDARPNFLLSIKHLAGAVLTIPGIAREAVGMQRNTLAQLEEKAAEALQKV